MATDVIIAERKANRARIYTPKVTIFYCVNACEAGSLKLGSACGDIEQIKIPCSAMVRDVFLLKAFEAGAAGVLVVACAPEKCKRGTGSLYAEKRVTRTRKILDEIGLGGWRLAFARADEAENVLARLTTEIALHNKELSGVKL